VGGTPPPEAPDGVPTGGATTSTVPPSAGGGPFADGVGDGGGDGDGPAVGADGATPPTASPRHPHVRTAIEWVAVLTVALVAAFLVRTYVVQTYFIPSASMEPTLKVGDHIVVLKAAYRFTSPAIGDIIVFKAPPAERAACADPSVQDLVKRIVAVPGDVITSRNDAIYVNHKLLKQPWTYNHALGTPITGQKIPPGQYFVMGDNRPDSCDSRIWGTVPRGNIIGKAVFVFWPLSQVKPL
jgi:signal peptidase I